MADELPELDAFLPTKDVDGIPFCRKHHCRMTQVSGGRKGNPKSYYKCRVAGCDETAQHIKTNNEGVVPREPQACPRCSKVGKPVYCERDPKASTAAMAVLKCPSCGWKSTAMVMPQLAAAQLAARRPQPLEANVGDR